FVTIHYKSRISEDFGDFQYTSLLGAYYWALTFILSKFKGGGKTAMLSNAYEDKVKSITYPDIKTPHKLESQLT
ncbi:hypothetical protein, partial [Enterococcus cecorum]|uniref:hypothetical protein n=1 Tax=Enterococcus cecorum TaxID=44008 RepID=UPI001AEBFC46